MYYVLFSDNILIPVALQSKFNRMRAKFARTFLSVREFISSHNAPVEKIKEFLEYFPYLKLQVKDCKTVRDVLLLIGEKSTLIDISVLEHLVEYFKINEAKEFIETYKCDVEQFCKEVSVRLVLEERFRATSSNLKCETATFVLDWNPDHCTIDDVRCLLSVAFERLSINVKVIVITEGNSIVNHINEQTPLYKTVPHHICMFQ